MTVDKLRPVLVYMTETERAELQALASLSARTLSQEGRYAVLKHIAAGVFEGE